MSKATSKSKWYKMSHAAKMAVKKRERYSRRSQEPWIKARAASFSTFIARMRKEYNDRHFY